ncbi:D-2-hydroxyacid dehydrogenase [Flammeovirga kamogawensis]|uniref:D-2-hydroxyacid dehydrogenase n=2 Tax=Flammeovirga kamogawensis TaxID=373891 RepID=A0ABX8H107_9BACT|nr:D-2-hydroxyacid dehydrogenase [Flammeovirga kamogawensis]TRX70165.1 D-2-hydroxyacid dehydrogenase [Flammeovirga kamogawensis]
MPKIVFLDTNTLGNDVHEELQRFKNLGDVIYYDSTTANEITDKVKNAEIIVTNKVVITKEIMASCSQLKLIVVTATGTNNVDLTAAKELEIVVKNAVNYSSESVAQQTFAMLLSLMNGIHTYDSRVKSGQYSEGTSFTWIGNSFSEIAGKRFGIIGLGNIGTRVAEIATAFGAEVIYYSTSGISRNEKYKLVDKEELFSTSDIISIHSPLNDKTANFVGEEEFKLMPTSSILINTGRGGIVNESDLANALNTNEIAGAAVDVFAVEPIQENNPLLSIDVPGKILLSPHVAWASKEARKKLLEITYANIKEVNQS